jgi:hypothetical protein
MATAVPAGPAPGSRPLIANRAKRVTVLKAIEDQRNSRVIAYITADRPALGAQIHNDVVPFFYDHLRSIGTSQRVDVFLYTRGGSLLAPNRLIHLLREHCQHVGVLVPFRAHSAGTILALGANEIVMGPLGELGPVDPTVSNAFNPDNETKKPDKGQGKIPISVEDVTAYLALARDKAGLETPETMVEVLRLLSENIHPLALGNVYRQYQLIRTVSRRLLSLHLDSEKDKERIEHIIDLLSEKLYFHGYEISRHEAKEMVNLPVTYPDEPLEKSMWELFGFYRADIPLAPLNLAGNFVADAAVVESAGLTHSYVMEGVATTAKGEVNIELRSGGWRSL